jgi:hypothetical protein
MAKSNVFKNWFSTFYIVEYAPRDSLGRTRDWCYWGMTADTDRITEMRDEIESYYQPNNVEIRVHPYNHAHGNNA